MSRRELRALLDDVPDTRELVLRRTAASGPAWTAVHDAWWNAREESRAAYLAWRRTGGADAYAAYRAAQDREDAAQDALAASTGER
jgi:hypothetical protein